MRMEVAASSAVPPRREILIVLRFPAIWVLLGFKGGETTNFRNNLGRLATRTPMLVSMVPTGEEKG